MLRKDGGRGTFYSWETDPFGPRYALGVEISNHTDLGDSSKGKEEGRTGEEKGKEPQNLTLSMSE